jgi:hypothetical protein
VRFGASSFVSFSLASEEHSLQVQMSGFARLERHLAKSLLHRQVYASLPEIWRGLQQAMSILPFGQNKQQRNHS